MYIRISLEDIGRAFYLSVYVFRVDLYRASASRKILVSRNATYCVGIGHIF